MAARGKSGGRIIILVALILILLVGAVYVWLQMQPSTTAQTETPVAQPMVDIVITTQAVPRGAEITADTVMTIQYPEANLIQGTFITDIASVIGSRAKYDLDPGVPLTPAVLISPTGGSAVSFDVPKDFVALPVPVDELTSVANALAAGDHVMVIGCMLLVDLDPDWQTILPNSLGQPLAAGTNLAFSNLQLLTANELGTAQGEIQAEAALQLPTYIVPSERQRPRLVCQTVIQDAVVLRLGNFIEPVVQPTPSAEEAEAAPVPTELPGKDSVTLVISPQDAVSLNYMMVAGIRLSMALRNPNDANPIVTDAVTQQYLMEQKNIPVPAKLPYGLEPRIDVVPTIESPEATPQP